MMLGGFGVCFCLCIEPRGHRQKEVTQHLIDCTQQVACQIQKDEFSGRTSMLACGLNMLIIYSWYNNCS